MAFDPVTAGIGLATTIGGGIFGAMGQAEENRKNRKAAKKQNKYNKKVWRFNNSEQDRIYDFKVEEQKIAKRNYEADIQFQEDTRQQQWDYQMGIRDYQFSQEMRAYEESVNRATKQKSFNQLAEELAIMQQDRFLQENLANLAFNESQTMMDFAAATAGLDLKRGQAKAQAGLARQRIDAETTLGIKTARTQTQLARQQATIESLKARGQAMAAGQAGRSSRKVSQGIRAEAGAQQASLVEQFLLSEESLLTKQLYDTQNVVQQLLFTEQGIDLNLTQLNGQLEMDKLQLKAARENLNVADSFSRSRIQMERIQSDLEAEANIRLKPEIAPPLPKPMALPRKEWAKIFRPGEAPEPNKVQAQVTNPYLTLGQSVVSGIGGLASAGAFDNMFTPQSSGFDMGNLSNIFSLDNQNPLTTISGFPTSSVSSGLT